MALTDPYVAYNAGSNLEAHMVCGRLLDAGIEALVVEDVSQAGIWVGGTIAGIHKPQVWIERADIERAAPVLTDYEQATNKRLAAEYNASGTAEPPVTVLCDGCGKRSTFPASQKGLVESCPHCGAYVDVGDEVGFEGWNELPETSADEAEPEDQDATDDPAL